MSEKLKPCPCGGEARLIVDYSYGRKGYSAQCQDCNRGTGTYDTKEGAVKAWNKTCDRINAEKIIETDPTNKADAGKARISLVPPQIVFDIAQVREYGNRKYGDSENWKTVEPERYIDALGRHYFEMIKNPHGKDKESGIENYKHLACNAAFLCEMLKDEEKQDAPWEEVLPAMETEPEEKKTSRLSLFIKPSVAERLKKKAKMAGVSMNELVNRILEYTV